MNHNAGKKLVVIVYHLRKGNSSESSTNSIYNIYIRAIIYMSLDIRDVKENSY